LNNFLTRPKRSAFGRLRIRNAVYYIIFFSFFSLFSLRLWGHILQDDTGQNCPHSLYHSWFGMYNLFFGDFFDAFSSLFLLTSENTHFSFFSYVSRFLFYFLYLFGVYFSWKTQETCQDLASQLPFPTGTLFISSWLPCLQVPQIIKFLILKKITIF